MNSRSWTYSYHEFYHALMIYRVVCFYFALQTDETQDIQKMVMKRLITSQLHSEKGECKHDA